ncbi:MAG TPA: cation acetate symporter, partial [Pseudonocardiaceae bacterium]|nr:cation acetate symporter [Pseudonocardiaceae bacterium]
MAAVAALTGFVGLYGARMNRPPSDFLAASQTVRPRLNAVAICGEYLSAASFLGIAGLILQGGVDALWYPVGFTAGYIALLLFVAAPLRRSGAYTLPDFAEARLTSVRLRRICTAFVVIIGWLYLVPQLQGAGLTVATVTGFPVWVGAAMVAVLVTFNIFTGWMHSITFVQAFQYWIKLTALGVPIFVLLIYQTGESDEFRGSLGAPAPPFFSQTTTVDIDTDVVLQVKVPTWLEASGEAEGAPVNGPVYWAPGNHAVGAGSTLIFAAGTRTPTVSGAPGPVNNADWMRPFSSGDYSVLTTYSLIVALLLGTMGLPHVLGRYYTNPDGRAARSTTLVVLGLLGLFYLLPVISGALARLYVPQLLLTGKTDAAVLLLPRAVLSGWPADLLGGVIAAGAFAAFMSAASGLAVSVAGVLSTDVLPGRLRDYRPATLLSWSVPLALALSVSALSLAQSVGLAFAVAASSFCPLLVLGIWWRGLTDVGAAAGMLAGGGLAVLSVLPAALGVLPPGWQELLAQPALFTVPLAFLVMV